MCIRKLCIQANNLCDRLTELMFDAAKDEDEQQFERLSLLVEKANSRYERRFNKMNEG